MKVCPPIDASSISPCSPTVSACAPSRYWAFAPDLPRAQPPTPARQTSHSHPRGFAGRSGSHDGHGERLLDPLRTPPTPGRVPRLPEASPRQQWRPEPRPSCPTSTSRLSGSPRARRHCPSQVAPSPTVRRLFAGSGRLRAPLRRPRAHLPGRLAASYTAAMHCDDAVTRAGTRRSRPVAGDNKYAIERLHSRLAWRGYETGLEACVPVRETVSASDPRRGFTRALPDH